MIIIYVALCVIGYEIMSMLYKRGVHVLPNVKHEWLYYVLQFTWGLPINIIGGIVALILLAKGKKPIKHGWSYCFGLDVNWGLELGVFFIAPIHCSVELKNHEHGHGIQNIYFGPFAIGMVNIPSAIRFWYREIKVKLGGKLKTEYDDIWFEGQATASGNEFLKKV